MTTPPNDMVDLAHQAGFEIRAWDETRGELHALSDVKCVSWPDAPGQLCQLGTHEELRSFLAGFIIGLKDGLLKGRAAARREEMPRPWRHLLVLRSREPATPEQPSCEAFTRPWAPFRGECVAIPDDVARHFDVIDVRVGNRSQLLSRDDQSAPATLYAARLDRRAILSLSSDGTAHRLCVEHAAEAEFGRVLHMQTCQVAQNLIVSGRLRRGSPPTTLEVMILGFSASDSG